MIPLQFMFSTDVYRRDLDSSIADLGLAIAGR